ncbi:unnamed protein product [Urochloa decumbens]|uniref:DUF1618 domain-containing protein n=2 Tax=Urochloa decumbens TaxID=240449 RepID=A0ABC9DDH8_9POAL
MGEALVDRYVHFEDELSMIIEERGGTPESLTVEWVLEKLYALDLSGEEMKAAVEREMEQVMLRYREEVELPAEVILRERKASRPSAVQKVPVSLSGNNGYDAAFYREALDGIEVCLRQVAPPGLTSLVLRVSWPGDSALRNFPAAAFISSTDHNILVLYVGPYRPGLSAPGFYLVYDAWANSVEVVPQLPSHSVTLFSHCSIGTGVAVLRYSLPSDYVLVELLPHQDSRGLISNMATLFMWHSSGPFAGRWVQKEVVLPLPSEPEEHTSQPSYNFCADTVFAVGNICLCWVDLLQGILVCDYVLADHPEFRFVKLPEACSVGIKPDPDGGRGLPGQYRSMCCKRRGADHVIKFIFMHRHGQGAGISGVALSIWTLEQPCNKLSKWKAGRTSFGMSAILADAMHNHNLKLLPLTPSCPVVSMLHDDIAYISFDDMSDDFTEARGPCILRLDMKGQRVLSAFVPHPGSRVFPLPDVFASIVTMYLNKKREWKEAMKYKRDEEMRERGYWAKREKSATLSTSRDVIEMGSQHLRHAQIPTGLGLPSSGRPSPRSSSSSSKGPSVGLALLLDDI